MIPHGSGPLTARGRAALWALLEPNLSAWCERLGLGTFRFAERVESGSHHLVWHVRTADGQFAIRPSALVSRQDGQRHQRSERLWKRVGQWDIAPKYFGSIPFQSSAFSGRIEAFDWKGGRPLRASRDGEAMAETLAALHARAGRSLEQALPPRPLRRFIHAELRAYQRRNHASGEIETILRERTRIALDQLGATPEVAGRRVLVHNDLVDGNVICAKSRVWLIDWDWAMISSPCVDLYCFLSPFVRSWGSMPGHLSQGKSEHFLRAYFAAASKPRSGGKLGRQAAFWGPYNALLANWLYHEATRWPHTGKAWFYREAFARADRLYQVVEAFK